MATLTAARAASTFPVAKPIGAGILCCAYGVYTPTVNFTAADIIEFCRIPAGAVVVGGYLIGADIDTGTETLDIDIGWAANGVEVADPDGFGNFGVSSGDVIVELIPVPGIYRPFQGTLMTLGPQTFSAETTITGTVNAIAATFATGPLTCVVHYVSP